MTFRQTLSLIFLAAAALVLPSLSHGQGPTYHPPVDPHNVTVPNLNHPVDLTANWLIHQGDDPTYASPALDDSQWTVIEAARPLSAYGINYPDFLWYRTHVHIPPHQHHLGILLRVFGGSEQIFVNGVLTGPSTDFPIGGGRSRSTPVMIDSLPDGLVDSGDLTIAVRTEVQAAGAGLNAVGFNLYTTLSLGDEAILEQEGALFNFRGLTSNTVNAALTGLVLLIAIALALALRDDREYVALCLFLLASLANDTIDIWRYTFLTTDTRGSSLPGQVATLVMVLAGMEFARMVLRLPRSRWIVIYEWTIGTIMVAASLLEVATYSLPSPPRSTLYILAGVALLVIAPLNLGLPLFALWIWRRKRNFDALLLSIPLLARGLFFYIQIALAILFAFHLSKRSFLPPASSTYLYFRWDEVGDFLFLLALLGFLILRTVRLARARAALAAEVAAAEHVQQLLLTGSSQPTPGFRVETAFYPASQVGGDFFLLTPFEDNSLLAIVGDVSGKGLTAAMRVAMILGILRRETSRDPAAVLANLNDALLSQSEMGFTTACCVHLFPDGRFIAANAGHICPYIAGTEIETPPALPLGLAPDQMYDFITGQLSPSETMVLMSDGVPEARNTRRELYGFDRLPNLTLQSAQEIADTAVRFGQEDDITVLTLAVA